MSGRPAPPPGAMELEAEREKIRREIEELERSLQPAGSGLDVSDCSLGSGTGFRALRARRARWRRCEEPPARAPQAVPAEGSPRAPPLRSFL